MKKPLLSRILGLAVLYCTVFFFLVILQFSGKGNFTLTAGEMTIKGRYLDSDDTLEPTRAVTGGVKIFFGGLEFNLKDDSGKGLTLSGSGGRMPVNPLFITMGDNSARLDLPGGTALTFASSESARGPELQINAAFAENYSEVVIPITPRRSSMVRENDQIGIMYNGSRFLFSGSGAELESGKIILTNENTLVSYRSRGKQKEFDPADYIIAGTQNYESSLLSWRDSSYAWWRQNVSTLQSADDVAAYCAEALRRGQYAAAVASIPASYLTGPHHSHIASGFVGGMTTAFRSFTAEEQEKTNSILRLIMANSPDVFKEEHLLDYLLSRGNNSLANEIINLVQNIDGEALTIDHCAGLLEFYSDYKRWRPVANPVEPLTDKILLLISENLNRNTERDLVLAGFGEKTDYTSLRLGRALIGWADDISKAEWEAIGRSLVLSALTAGGEGVGELYNALDFSDYYPRAALLADNGLWTWTVSPSTRASYNSEGNLNISFSFPVNMSHYVIICGVRPFIKLQIHDMDWRSDSQFEIYDSSGWLYYSREQMLVLKIKHRESVENIRIFYRVPPPPPVIIEEDIADNDIEDDTESYN